MAREYFSFNSRNIKLLKTNVIFIYKYIYFIKNDLGRIY